MNTETTVKIPGAWLFRSVSLLLNIALLAAIFWIRAEIRNEIRAELGSYMTVKEFEAYQRAHEQWGDQVVKRLQSGMDECIRRMDRIEIKVDRIFEQHGK